MNTSAEEIATIKSASIAAISDALDTLSRKQWVFNEAVTLRVGKRIFGQAITIMVAATGEKAPQKIGMKCLDECSADSVVVAAGEPDMCALFTAQEIELATRRSLGGLITDCAVRTTGLRTSVPIGVAARGTSVANGFGRVKTLALCEAVECAGVRVSRGDLVSGDETGIVVIPAALMSKVSAIVQAFDERIANVVASVAGSTSLQEAVDRYWT